MKKLSMTPGNVRKRAKAHALRVKKANLAFKKLTKQQKRIAVAQDVLKAIQAKKLIAKNRVYVESEALESLILANQQVEVCNLLPEVESCNVCAKGALFLSCLAKKDALKGSSLIIEEGDEGEYNYVGIDDNDRIVKYLSDVFTKAQLDLIEGHFERFGSFDQYGGYYAPFFRDDLKSAEDRLVAIMENIVEHKGTFVPHPKPKK